MTAMERIEAYGPRDTQSQPTPTYPPRMPDVTCGCSVVERLVWRALGGAETIKVGGTD